MPDFLLELLSEEIPARMQAKAEADLARLFAEQLAAAGLYSQAIETFSTPRRLALIARALPAETAAASEEVKGPRTSAPPQALEGFLRKTGLTQEQLVERDGVYFAQIEKPGRSTASVLAEAIPAIFRAFPWPKSMRWGAASVSTESPRWVRPLQGLVAMLGEEIVPVEIGGIVAGAATVGHRFHHPGIITLGGANDYSEKLRACHVIVDAAERRRIIAEGAAAAASAAGLALVEDEGLLAENAGLTEWPVPLLGDFDPAFLEVPREIIQLTMRTNQKYFACVDAGGALAPAFICTANIEAADGGAAIVAGNRKVLAARLADAKFFWEQDLKVTLEEQAAKLNQIVFHEKLGTVADKVDRVAKLARWLVEEGVVRAETPARPERSRGAPAQSSEPRPSTTLGTSEVGELADLAERAARLCKADLVTGLVGEFPELQGIIGGYIAAAQGEHPAIAAAICDHYKPVGQGDEVPTDPVTVAVSLADKLDTVSSFFHISEQPTGSRDPFALRRSALSVISQILRSGVRLELAQAVIEASNILLEQTMARFEDEGVRSAARALRDDQQVSASTLAEYSRRLAPLFSALELAIAQGVGRSAGLPDEIARKNGAEALAEIIVFFVERLIVQQRDAGVRRDIVEAVFGLADDSDLVRLLARVRALQSFVETAEGADLLAGYKRAANILKKENWTGAASAAMSSHEEQGIPQTGEEDPLVLVDDPQLADAVAAFNARNPQKPLSYTPLPEEARLIAALDSAEPRAAAAVEAEDFEGAMAALASLRGPVDAFFDKVIVNDPDPSKRAARLDLLARMREAVHKVADFSRIEG